MPDAPLSRRARRTFEEEAADRAASQDPTLAFARGVASGEIEAVDPDTGAISRRDRRRMERLAQPLEAWTAEEEMIATGQIPRMTPERIAEQERISRDKADKAAQEAIAASQEFRRLAESEIRRVQAPAFEAPAFEAPAFEEPAFEEPAFEAPAAPSWGQPAPVEAPAFEAPAAPSWGQPAPVEAPVVESHVALPEWARPVPTDLPEDVEAVFEPAVSESPLPEQVLPEQAPAFLPAPPESAAPEFVAPEAPPANVEPDTAQAPSEAGARVGKPVLEAYQPTMVLDETPLARVVHPVREDTPASVREDEPASFREDAPAPAEPMGADAPVAERPSIFDELFPPGSTQAMLRQQDPFATGSHAVQVPAESGQIPNLLPPQEVQARTLSPAEEMRRLAEEAMSGIERAARANEATAAAAAAVARPGPDPSVAAEFDSLLSASSRPAAQVPGAPIAQQEPAKGGALAEFAWTTEGGGAPSANPTPLEPTFDSIPGMPRSADPAPATPSGGLAPHQAGFDQLVRPASGQFSMPGQQGQPTSGQFSMPGQQGQPTSGQFPMPSQQSTGQGYPSAPHSLAAPMGPAWNSQPMSQASGNGVEAKDFTPLSNVPTPDFSGLYQQASPSMFPPITGAINTAALNAAEFHGGDLSSMGQVPSIRRPDLPEVGGAKHFKWLHLAVIGALMFVLGVVIYNAAFAS